MVCMPTLKRVMRWDTWYKRSKDILCSEEKLLMEYEVVGYQKGWCKTSFHALRVASECLKDYLTVSRHHNKPIRGGTNSGCIDRIDNSILNLYLARTQQRGWQSQGRQGLDFQWTNPWNELPPLYSQRPGRICCISSLRRMDSALRAALGKRHIAVRNAPLQICSLCL